MRALVLVGVVACGGGAAGIDAPVVAPPVDGPAGPPSWPTGDSPWDVATGDLNGDGKPDVVVANLNSFNVSVFLDATAAGATTPTLAGKGFLSLNMVSAYAVAIGDLNADGRPDLAVASDYRLCVFLNTTTSGSMTPTFAARADFPPGALNIAISDVDGDGKPDLIDGGVLINATADGSSTASFAATTAGAAGGDTLAVGDLDGDGKPDLAFASAGAGSLPATVTVQLNTTATPGAPSFSSPATFVLGNARPKSIAIADINGDGKPDLVIADQNQSIVSVLLDTIVTGSGTASFAAHVDFKTGFDPQSVAVADFNGDGKPDLVVANEGSDNVSVLLNTTPTGSMTPSLAGKLDYGAGTGPISVAVGDFNGDGKPDVAVANRFSNTVSLLLDVAK